MITRTVPNGIRSIACFMVLVVAFCLTSSPLPAQTTISDTVFFVGEWEEGIAQNPSGTGNYEMAQTLGGNPGRARRHRIGVGQPFTHFLVVQDFVGDDFVPLAQGPVSYIDATFDAKMDTVHVPSQTSYSLQILQEGVEGQSSHHYVASPRTVGVSGLNMWEALIYTGLTSDSFVNLYAPGPTHPDFSTSGGRLVFGLAVRFETAGSWGYSYSTLDTWVLRIYNCIGDPECDGTLVDVQDVVATIGRAFRGQTAVAYPGCAQESTDVDCSGATDIQDVVHVVNVAFRGATVEEEFCLDCL